MLLDCGKLAGKLLVSFSILWVVHFLLGYPEINSLMRSVFRHRLPSEQHVLFLPTSITFLMEISIFKFNPICANQWELILMHQSALVPFQMALWWAGRGGWKCQNQYLIQIPTLASYWTTGCGRSTKVKCNIPFITQSEMGDKKWGWGADITQ